MCGGVFACADAVRHPFLQFWRCFKIASVNHEINEEIIDKELRVISDDGEQLGIMSAEEALKIAEEKEKLAKYEQMMEQVTKRLEQLA